MRYSSVSNRPKQRSRPPKYPMRWSITTLFSWCDHRLNFGTVVSFDSLTRMTDDADVLVQVLERALGVAGIIRHRCFVLFEENDVNPHSSFGCSEQHLVESALFVLFDWPAQVEFWGNPPTADEDLILCRFEVCIEVTVVSFCVDECLCVVLCSNWTEGIIWIRLHIRRLRK